MPHTPLLFVFQRRAPNALKFFATSSRAAEKQTVK
jgi:hypothetical protein